MNQFHGVNAYDWINRRKGIIPPIMGKQFKDLPDELADVISGLSDYGIARGILRDHVRNLPPTGPTGDRPVREEWAVEWATIRLSAALDCDILGYPGEKKGEYLHQVIPVHGREESRSNEGANLFEAHMEAPHLPDPPDLVMLVCLRNTERGPTTLWPMDVLLSQLDEREMSVAFQPRFLVEMGESWGERSWFEHPVLDRNEFGELKLRLDLTSMKGKDEEAQRILDKLFAFCVTPDGVLRNCVSVVLEPGDALLFDNRKNCHGRAPIPQIGLAAGDRRWLQRVYLRRKSPV
ncbi:TauD/TfdA family dioxygenase [Azospirillum doebereinerae]